MQKRVPKKYGVKMRAIRREKRKEHLRSWDLCEEEKSKGRNTRVCLEQKFEPEISNSGYSRMEKIRCLAILLKSLNSQ